LAEIPAITADDPLIDTAPNPEAELDPEIDDDSRDSLVQQLAKMSFTERLKAAMKGSRGMRAILVRDPNKMIAAAVLSSSKLSESEIEAFARMTNVGEEVLRIIASNRAWTKNYGVVVGLTKNPKTPLGVSLTLMSRLNERDISALSMDRNVPDSLRTAAKRRAALGNTS
jgi:hypothetical protein